MRDISKMLENRRKLLQSFRLKDEDFSQAQKERADCAKVYLVELEEVEHLLANQPGRVFVVPRPTLEKKIREADWAEEEYIGCYIKIYHILNFPGEYWLVHWDGISTFYKN